MITEILHTLASLFIICTIGYGFYVMVIADEESRQRDAGKKQVSEE